MRTFVFRSLMWLSAWGLAAGAASAQELGSPAADATQPNQAQFSDAEQVESLPPVYHDPSVAPAGCQNCGMLGEAVLAAPSWDGFGGYTPVSYSHGGYGGGYPVESYDQGVEYGYGPAAIPPDPKGGAWHSKCPIMWTFRADVMIMERDDVRDRTIVVDDNSTPATPLDDIRLLGTGDISLNYDTSFRVALISQRQWDISWELAYFGLFEWDRFIPTVARNTLAVPFDTDFSTEFDDADLITVQYVSELHNAELNRRYHVNDDAKLLLGFRYFNLNERFSIDAFDRSFTGGAVFDGSYHTDTDNHLAGFQIGAEASQCCKMFGFTGGVKGGVYNNYIEKHVNLQGQPNNFLEPPFLLQIQDSGSEVAFVGEAYFEATVQVRKSLAGQIGWRALFVDGVALAPEQFDSSLTPASTSTPLNHSGSVMYHAFYGGFTTYW